MGESHCRRACGIFKIPSVTEVVIVFCFINEAWSLVEKQSGEINKGHLGKLLLEILL